MKRLERLLELWEKLGEIEREVLATFTERLYMGQEAYGFLTYGKKDWVKEAYEESLDRCVYDTVEYCKRLHKKAQFQKLQEKLLKDYQDAFSRLGGGVGGTTGRKCSKCGDGPCWCCQAW